MPKRKDIDFELLRQHFAMPISDVAEKFAVCTTLLKKICRKNGIRRWPHRKLRCLEKVIEGLEAAKLSSREPGDDVRYDNEIEQLRQQQQQILRNPNRDLHIRSTLKRKFGSRATSGANSALSSPDNSRANTPDAFAGGLGPPGRVGFAAAAGAASAAAAASSSGGGRRGAAGLSQYQYPTVRSAFGSESLDAFGNPAVRFVPAAGVPPLAGGGGPGSGGGGAGSMNGPLSTVSNLSMGSGGRSGSITYAPQLAKFFTNEGIPRSKWMAPSAPGSQPMSRGLSADVSPYHSEPASPRESLMNADQAAMFGNEDELIDQIMAADPPLVGDLMEFAGPASMTGPKSSGMFMPPPGEFAQQDNFSLFYESGAHP